MMTSPLIFLCRYARWWRIFLWIIFLPPLLLSLALLWLKSDSGQHWVLEQINHSGLVRIKSYSGSPWGTLTVTGLEYEDQDVVVKIDQSRFKILPYAFLSQKLWFRWLECGQVSVLIKPRPPGRPPAPAPTDLQLPFGLSVDRGQIHILHLVNLGRDFTALHFEFSSNGRRHHLRLHDGQSDLGHANADVILDGRAPFQLAASYTHEGRVEGRHVTSKGYAAGPLRAIVLGAEVRSDKEISGHIDARVDLFADYAYQMLQSGRVSLHEVNPARLSRLWPQAKLDIQLEMVPTAEGARGHLAIKNRDAGTLDRQRIPLRQLDADLNYAGGKLDFQQLKALSAGLGRIEGRGLISAGQVDLALDVAELDLVQVWSRQAATALHGHLDIQGPWLAPNLRGAIADHKRQVRLSADLGWIRPDQERRLAIRQIELIRGAQRLAVQGEWSFDAQQDFRLSGQFTAFDPAQWLAIPAGHISGELQVNGALQPQPAAVVDFKLHDSLFHGSALAGRGRLSLDSKHLAESDFWLSLGSNRVDVTGAWGLNGEGLKVLVDCRDLRALGPGFGGHAQGKLYFSGPVPQLEGRLDLAGIVSPWGVQAQSAKLEAQIAQNEEAPLHIQIEATGLEYAAHRWDRLRLSLKGSRQQHDVSLDFVGTEAALPLQLKILAHGGLSNTRTWQGTLAHFDLKSIQNLHLLQPTPMQLGQELVQLGAADWDLGGGRLSVSSLRWQNDRLTSSGTFSRTSLSPWFKALRKDLDSDLVVGGRWDIRWDGKLDGDLALWREQGDALWRGPTSNRLPLALQSASLQVQARQNWLEWSGQVESGRYGATHFSGKTLVDMAHGRIADDAPVELDMRGQVPELAVFNALTGPGFQLQGQLAFNVQHQGSIQQGHFSGDLTGRGLGIHDPVTGLELRDGYVRVALDDRSLILHEAHFKGGQGTVSASGRLDLGGQDPDGQAEIKADHLRLFGRPDLLLVLSGQGKLGFHNNQISLDGRFKADEGDLRYRSIDVPRLADDVIVMGAKPDEESVRLPQTSLQLDVDLGEHFRFRGLGTDAQLSGRLRLRAQPAKPLSATGIVQVDDGQYRAYGRKLDIERGLLSFQGPIDNPGLDILAMRRNQTVESGVIVLGTARNPRVQLYSEPTVPDTEKMSWLLFGHGTDSMDKTDSTILLQGVNALLGDEDGGASEKIFDTIGIEEIEMSSVKSENGKPTQVVTVSKRVGRNLRLSVEKSINGLNDAVRLAYQFSQRWSLITRWGTDQSSLEASYTFRFDW